MDFPFHFLFTCTIWIGKNISSISAAIFAHCRTFLFDRTRNTDGRIHISMIYNSRNRYDRLNEYYIHQNNISGIYVNSLSLRITLFVPQMSLCKLFNSFPSKPHAQYIQKFFTFVLHTIFSQPLGYNNLIHFRLNND